KDQIQIQPLNPLCPLCSGNLLPIEKSRVQIQLPPFVSHVYHDFWQCDNSECQKYYWRGIKWRDFIKMITQHIENHTRQDLLKLIMSNHLKPHRWVVWTLHGLGDGFKKEKDMVNAKIAYENAYILSSNLLEHEKTVNEDKHERKILYSKLNETNHIDSSLFS
ncbi:MAG: Mut7-C RNAse domain-containing protein, partial [Promethearchaeota archaeon]